MDMRITEMRAFRNPAGKLGLAFWLKIDLDTNTDSGYGRDGMQWVD